MKQKVFIIFLGLLCQLGIAQDFNAEKLNQYFDALEARNKFMGSVAISQNGEQIYSRAIGYLDVENKLKANEYTVYRIGSISKSFTTVLVLKAIEANKLTLNQPINTFFPTLKNAEKITIQQLLSHQSGIHNFTNDPTYSMWHTQPKTEKEMLAIITQGGSDFEPGTKEEYSNSNFVLLSYILEKTFKKSYAELLKEYITEPLHLKHTYFGGKINPQNNEALSYLYMGNWQIEAETDMSIPLGAGGIVSTPSDLVQFSDALFEGKLVKPESLEQMKNIQDNIGMGLFQTPFDDKIGYGHGGKIDGFNSFFSYFPDGKISFAITSNGANMNTNDISIILLEAAFKNPFEIPSFQTYKLTPKELTAYEGIYNSAQVPLKITITQKDNALIAQATGQSSFPLEATHKNIFKFNAAGIVMEFNPKENTMTLKQGGGTYLFTKE